MLNDKESCLVSLAFNKVVAFFYLFTIKKKNEKLLRLVIAGLLTSLTPIVIDMWKDETDM